MKIITLENLGPDFTANPTTQKIELSSGAGGTAAADVVVVATLQNPQTGGAVRSGGLNTVKLNKGVWSLVSIDMAPGQHVAIANVKGNPNDGSEARIVSDKAGLIAVRLMAPHVVEVLLSSLYEKFNANGDEIVLPHMIDDRLIRRRYVSGVTSSGTHILATNAYMLLDVNVTVRRSDAQSQFHRIENCRDNGAGPHASPIYFNAGTNDIRLWGDWLDSHYRNQPYVGYIEYVRQ